MKRKSDLRIQDIIDAIESITRAIKGIAEKDFCENEVLLSAVIRWLEIIGEAAKYVPIEIKQKNTDIPWKEMAAMRDVAIHDYAELIPEDIWKTITKDIPLLCDKIKKIKLERL
ncbi:MAG: HepT-like ribonuclease domain-containing protein [Patescibacteria group bacterium]